MQLIVDGQPRSLMPMREFRAAYSLPPDFGVNWFTPKDYTGLGRIDGAGDELEGVASALLASIPNEPPTSWMGFTVELQQTFHKLLWDINPKVGLRRSEVEYAVVGLGEVCQSFVHTAMKERMSGRALPTFERVYQDWLNRTTRTSERIFPYPYRGRTWGVRIIQYAYGRIGLVVDTEEQTYYVRDFALACPAEGFMAGLLQAVVTRLAALLERASAEAGREA
jgi:hypothetical protein